MAKEEWSEVAERLEALALKLKMHLRQARGAPSDSDTAEPVQPVAGEVVASQEAASAKTDGVAEALETVRRGIEDAFDAAGNAIKDEAVRGDFRDLGRTVSSALSSTWGRATDDIKEFLSRR